MAETANGLFTESTLQNPVVPPQLASLKDTFVRDVMQGLYDGLYHPGQRLTEADLVAQYGISRSTVREGLNRLTALGVVQLSGQRGAQIRSLSANEAIDILIIAEGLIKIAARFAALHIDRPGNKELLIKALERIALNDSDHDFGSSRQVRDNFYTALVTLSDLTELDRVQWSLPTHIVRVEFRSQLMSVDQYRYYKRIADAVLAGNPKAAEGAVKTHMRQAIGALVEYRDRSLRRRR